MPQADDEDTNDQQGDEFEEQSEETTDQAEDEATGVEGDDAADDEGKDGDDAESEGATDDDGDDQPLLSQKRIDELRNDPVQLNKELNAAATKKFQRLSAERKRLAPYADFFKAYEADPRQAAIALAQRLGIEVVKPRNEAAAEAAVEKLSDKIHAKVKAALGDEYADLSDRLSTAIHDASSLMVDEALKPLKEGQNTLIQDSAMRESAAVLEAFAEKHPDWKKYEKEMVALTVKLPPSEGVSEAEYLDNIYYLATREGKEGDTTKRVAKRMADSARKGGGGRTVSDNTVSKSPAGKLPSFAESAAAARRGETFD